MIENNRAAGAKELKAAKIIKKAQQVAYLDTKPEIIKEIKNVYPKETSNMKLEDYSIEQLKEILKNLDQDRVPFAQGSKPIQAGDLANIVREQTAKKDAADIVFDLEDELYQRMLDEFKKASPDKPFDEWIKEQPKSFFDGLMSKIKKGASNVNS